MKNLLAVLFLLGAACAQEKYKLCAPETITESKCNALQRSRSVSQVSCLRVTDSAECAVRMAQGKADFGIFTAEEMLLAYQFHPDKLQPITKLKHPDRLTEDFDFQSVAVVPADFDARDGLAGLKNGGFCHPGFSSSQRWNDLILKYFEKKVYEAWCRSDLTASENEAENLKNFFGKSCRPGEWVAQNFEDRRLKTKYSELCALCDDSFNCKYKNMTHHGHFGALDCLVNGRGKVAYVAYDYVKKYFGLDSNVTAMDTMAVPLGFQFLCSDGTKRPLTSKDPCAWVKQPWSAILARTEKASQLVEGLKKWLNAEKSQDWTTALNSIIRQDATPIMFEDDMNLRTYLASGRDVDLPKNTCGKNISWCTVNEKETGKCKWVAKEALALGIEPAIECQMSNSTFDCLRDIAESKADIITIDSNYGYLARHVFNLTTVMYSETADDKNSEVIAVVREYATAKVSGFKDLKKRTACFPEYGGIAWLSFINTLRTSKIISDSCDYPKIVSQFLAGACTPGVKDPDHSLVSTDSEASAILCSLCPLERTNVTCSATEDNYYYGDKGALECLKSGAGDVAFVEVKNLKGHIEGKVINPSDYRVLCKNGTLATYTGFDVDEQCALSVTIDSEVVGRKGVSDVFTNDVTMALMKIENWLGYRADILRPIRIYDSFTGSSDLLFKDSTIGLVPTSSEIKSVLAYKELFDHVETCSSVGATYASTAIVFLLLSISSLYSICLH